MIIIFLSIIITALVFIVSAVIGNISLRILNKHFNTDRFNSQR